MGEQGHVVVIGGGLAGMTVAKALADKGVAVTILEAGERLGGKAGADRRLLPQAEGPAVPVQVDHGYHIFPGWYRNVRRLLGELGIADRLLDTDTLYVLAKPERPGQPPRVYFHQSFKSLRAILHNMFESVLPWHLSFMSFFSLLDLAAEPFRLRGYLDRVSVSGFFRSRFYRHEAIANFHHQTVLQASAIPYYELSAMTMQKTVKSFMGTPSPMLSMLDGDLQTRFIEPFRRHLEQCGVRLLPLHAVNNLDVSGNRVTAIGLENDAAFTDAIGTVVMAVPHEVAATFVSPSVFEYDRTVLQSDEGALPLAGLWQLTSAPMAAFDVYFDQRLPDLPPWHTNLYGSKYGLSFIDISQHWPALKAEPRTVLSVIASNFKPLLTLPPHMQLRHLLGELFEYVGIDAQGASVIHIDAGDNFVCDGFLVEPADDASAGYRVSGSAIRVHFHPNTQYQLFLNTSGAWHHRPQARTALVNLYMAGDYCRSEADLTTMESAVMSGLTTAREILTDFGLRADDVGPLSLDLPPRWQLVALKYALLPIWLPLGLWYAVQRWADRTGG